MTCIWESFFFFFKVDLHDTTSRMSLSLWRIERSVNAVISIHETQAKFKMLYLNIHAFTQLDTSEESHTTRRIV